MRRDLSYETNSGPKTKTVETWDLAYYFFIVICYYSSASVIVFIVIEVRDSRTGYLLPARDGPGALPDMDSSWDAAAAVSQNVTLISFSFRA